MAFLDIDGTQLYYHTKGSGPPLLIMHGGLGLDHTYLTYYFDQLADAYELIYYDHRANGRSDATADGLSMQRLVEDAEALRAHLGHDKISLFGHSYGGFIAQEYAIRYADRLSALMLANTVPAFDYHPAVSGNEEQMAAFGTAFSRPMDSDEEWRTIWNTLSQMYFVDFDSTVGAQLDSNTIYRSAAWNAANGLLATFNTMEGLKSIGVPALQIAGRQDGICPPEHGAERINDLMPKSSLVIFEDSAHYPFIEEEAAFFKTVREWLSAGR